MGTVSESKDGLASKDKGFLAYRDGTVYSDANDIVKPGIYRINGYLAKNIPDSYGLLSVFCSISTGNETVTQLFVNSNNAVFSRCKWTLASAWSDWSRIDNFGYNTLADLSSAVAGLFQLKSDSQDIDNISDVFCFSRVRPSTSSSANELPFVVWFFLIQFVFVGNNIMQIAIAASVPKIKIRTRWNGVWCEWRIILLS